jgi:hypothetical protein
MDDAGDQAQPWNMQRVHQWVLRRDGFWEHERIALRAAIADDLRREGQGRCGR